MSADIFISYAREDRPRVGPLAQLLEAEGWSVWWDHDLLPGQQWHKVIEEALHASQCVIVVWTKASVKRPFVFDEAREGARRSILVPVLMENVRIPLGFGGIEAASLLDWQGERVHPGIARLIAAVTHFVGLPRKETPGQDEEDAILPPVALAPEPEGATEAIHDEIASEEEASVAEPESIHRPEEVAPEVEPVATERAETALIDDEPGVAEEPKADAAAEVEEPAVVEVEGGEAGVEAVEEAVREDLEEQPVAPPPEEHGAPPETLPEEEADTPEKPIPAELERWIKEPKRLVLVAVGVIVIAVILVVALQIDNLLDPDPLGVAAIKIDPPEVRVEVGSRLQLTATLRDSLDNLLDGQVGWESSDSSIASVDSAGVVRGVKTDSAHIIARSGGVERKIIVRVLPKMTFNWTPVGTMGRFEVTQGQWKAVMGTEPWKGKQYVREDDSYPAVYVTWINAKAFIVKLNELDSRYSYHLPSEEQWERAAKAGTTNRWAGTDSEDALCGYANVADASAKRENPDWPTVSCNDGYAGLAPVGAFGPNNWSLFDMSGNVWEWTETKSGSRRVVRGGGFDTPAEGVLLTFRNPFPPGSRGPNLGFRLVRRDL